MSYVCPLCSDDMTPCYITAENGHLMECHGMDKDWIGSSVNRSPVRPHVCAGCGYIALFAKSPEVFRQEANRSRGTLPIPVSERRLPPIDPKLPLAAGPQVDTGAENDGLEDQSAAPARR